MKIAKQENNKKTFIDKNLNNNKEEISKNEENQYLEKAKTVVIKKKKKKIIETGSFSNNKNSELIKEKVNANISNNSENSKSSNIKKINVESINKEKNKENKEKESSTDISYSIITLDIDGNVNLYQYGEEVTLFNLYNLKDISEKNKKDKFFSMGYEYYIKSNMEYFCISTDQGCFVVKKSL